mmetsp:Transcript_74515/g.120279  ORF Transcript_74515/g.120279 Transcript_74515/m.120279 type:complete len:200 (-) Transcript_74515:63-662(-)
MMSFQEKAAIGLRVRLPSSQTSRLMRWAAWSMRRPVMRMSFSHSASARWKGSTLLTKSKSAESSSSQSPYLAMNSSMFVTPFGAFQRAFLAYLSSTCFAQTSVVGKRCMVSMATKCMPVRTSGKCFFIRATNTLSVASHAVAKTVFFPSFGRCFSISRQKASTLPCKAEKWRTELGATPFRAVWRRAVCPSCIILPCSE